MLPEYQEWHDKYVFDIPVISLDDKELFRHRVEEGELLRTLEQSLKTLATAKKSNGSKILKD